MTGPDRLTGWSGARGYPPAALWEPREEDAVGKSWPLVILAALVALLVPLVGVWYATRQWSRQSELDQVRLMAVTVLERTEAISRQALIAANRLDAARGANPCSDANLALMRDIDLTSSYLQAVGYVEGNRLLCSSLGRHDPPVLLGPARYVSAIGVAIRPAEALSLTPGRTRVVAVRGHSALLLAPELITDLFSHMPGVSVGVYGTSSGVPVAMRGGFDARWRSRLGSRGDAAFIDGAQVVALQRSPKFDLTAYAVLPAGYGQQRAIGLLARLGPFALLLGVLSCAGVLWLAREQRAFPAMLVSALRNDEFFLAYQPIVELASGRWIGAETLIRWRRPDGSEVRPDVFIPVAEDNGLIARISGRVLKLLARDAPTILAVRPDFRFSVNLSQDDLMTPLTVHQLRGLLATGLKPANVTIEATERGVMEKEAATQVLREIRALGMRVAIDDFGTGYANLAYLHSFEVDAIKIDKSFVDTIGTEAVTAHVALLIIEMGKTLSLDLVAEGVEHARQADYLRENGVHYAQGWLFARPMRADELRAALAAQVTADGVVAGIPHPA
jgi:sensor c-di-GMP phosphodiesterase-like protein